MAAAALTEAYVAKEQFDKIEGLLPHLNTNTKSRFDPRLNYQFLQAGDHLASIKEYQKASLFYSLTMTPRNCCVIPRITGGSNTKTEIL